MKQKLIELKNDAIKEQDHDSKDVLRVLIGEIELTESREGSELADARIIKIAEKLLASNCEVMKVRPKDSDDYQRLVYQNIALRGIIPKRASKEEVFDSLSEIKDDLIKVGKVGPCIGLSKKHLDSAEINATIDDIKEIVSGLINA